MNSPATRKVELELCSVRIATQDGLNNITNGMEDGQRRMDGIVRQMARETQDHVSAGFQDLEASISSKMATQHDEYLDRISEIHDTNEQVNQALSRVEAAVNQQLDNSDAMVKQLQDIFAWMQEHGPPPQSPAQNSRPPDTANTNLRSDPENSNSGQGPECLPHKPPPSSTPSSTSLSGGGVLSASAAVRVHVTSGHINGRGNSPVWSGTFSAHCSSAMRHPRPLRSSAASKPA